MANKRDALTPEALAMIDTIARTGSFAAAARELGKVPSALTYSVRQLEEALDVLLFDRSSRQARFTAAGTELLHEGRRVLQALEAVGNRVQRVASGWEAHLSIVVDDVLSIPTVFDLVQAFCEMRVDDAAPAGEDALPAASQPPAGSRLNDAPRRPPGTRLRLRTDTLAGTWETLVSGQADLALGVAEEFANPGGIEMRPLGEMPFVFVVAPHHPLASATQSLDDEQIAPHRAVAVADTAQRLTPLTVNLLPGQDVLTVPTMRAKLEAQLRGLGCGFIPEPLARSHIEAGRLVAKTVARPAHVAHLHYAWRVERGAERGAQGVGKALAWWLRQLEHAQTRRALIERHAGLLG